jgi:peptidoglycan/LPS O-acetylase OafA/YrhL
LHLGYLNAFFNYDWIVALYWTLAIEFQFYLSIGLLFPLIGHRSLLIRSVTMCCLGGLFLTTPNTALITHYVFLFLLGIVTYQFRMKFISTTSYLFYVAVLLVLLIASLGVATALAGVATALTISSINANGGGVLQFFGKIFTALFDSHVTGSSPSSQTSTQQIPDVLSLPAGFGVIARQYLSIVEGCVAVV